MGRILSGDVKEEVVEELADYSVYWKNASGIIVAANLIVDRYSY